MNRFTNKIMKVFATALAMTAALSVTASAEFVYSKMIAEVVLVKDADGNEYEVTHRIDRQNLDLIEYYEGVPIEIINDIGEDIVGIYISDVEDTDWGENWLDSLGDAPVIHDGENAYLTMNYSNDNLVIDVKLVLTDDNAITYEDVDLSGLAGATHFEMRFYEDEESGGYCINTKV